MDDSPWDDAPSAGTRPNVSSTSSAQKATTPTTATAATAISPKPTSSSSSIRTVKDRQTRGHRKVSAKPTQLEAVENANDPLSSSLLAEEEEEEGPPSVSGIAATPAPPPSSKGAAVGASGATSTTTTTSTARATPTGAITPSDNDPSAILSPALQAAALGDDNENNPSAQRSSSSTRALRASQRRMTASRAAPAVAKASFEITVGDPHKVGDFTSSHTEYLVRTKTTSKAYRQPEFAVSRRYRDFLWLYDSLHSNNPGVIVPPPPEKQAVGRFDTEFVESRRAALERMLNKIAAHATLQLDADLKIFLESDSFTLDVKNKEQREPNVNLGLGNQNKGGMFSALSFGGGNAKFIEPDEWLHDRKLYLDALENQLKDLLKAVDTVVAQRNNLAESANDFALSLRSMASVELSPDLSGPLEGLSDLQVRINELYERQAHQDILTLGITVDEYIRLIGSVKAAFDQRQAAFHAWHTAESELLRHRNMQDKLLRQGRSQQDRLTQAAADVADGERKVHQSRLLFDDLGRILKNELERFEKEKVEDFKSGVETNLESAVEAQKELIDLWETFLLQLEDEEPDVLYHSQSTPAAELGAGSANDTRADTRAPAPAL